MKCSIRNIIGCIAIVAVYCSPVVDGIRSSTSLSSLQSSDRTTRTSLLNTRGGAFGYRNGDSSVSVVPEATLPQAISGGEVETETSDSDVEAVATDVVETTQAEAPAVKSSKWTDLITRVLSACGMIAFLGGLSFYYKEDGLSALVVVIQAMMYGEMTRTIGGDDWGSIGATLRKYWWFLTAVIVFNGPRVLPWKQMVLDATAFGMIVSVGCVGSILSFQSQKSGTVEFREFIRQTAVSLLSAITVVLPSSYWIGTLEEHGMKWIFVPAAFIAINDIMAYIFGRLIGRHPLLPAISPKKTWEGFLGAGMATVGAAWVALAEEGGSAALLGPGLEGITRTDGMILAAVASTVAPFAGFLASVIKRAYGRKDFGNSFPGHGGFIDRLDCQLIFAPFVYFYLTLYKAAPSS